MAADAQARVLHQCRGSDRQRPARPAQRRARTDPLAEVEYAGDLATDSAAELDAVAQRFRDRTKREAERFRLATDSDFWFAVVSNVPCSLGSSGRGDTVFEQEFVEFFGRGVPVEGLSGAGVEFVGDGVQVGLGVDGQVGAFGEVLAEQAVGVLVGAALPG